jgi:hypothetical protein
MQSAILKPTLPRSWSQKQSTSETLSLNSSSMSLPPPHSSNWMPNKFLFQFSRSFFISVHFGISHSSCSLIACPTKPCRITHWRSDSNKYFPYRTDDLWAMGSSSSCLTLTQHRYHARINLVRYSFQVSGLTHNVFRQVVYIPSHPGFRL